MNIFMNIKKALLYIQCPFIEFFDLSHMGCIPQICKKCPKFKMNKYNKKLTKNGPEILFHDFTVQKCYCVWYN